EKYSVYHLRKIAETEIQPHLRAISGVESVRLYGGVDPEIKIRTNMEKMKNLGVTLSFINAQIYRYFYTKQSVSFKKDGGEITLKLSETPENIGELQNILLYRKGDTGIYLKDVADVSLGYQRLQYEMRFQGKDYLVFHLFKERSYSHLDVAKRVRSKLQHLANRLEEKEIGFIIQSDESKDLSKKLVRLGKIAILILFIIFFILLAVVKEIRASLLIFSSVFFSVFATLTALYLFDIELNILTLSGLALGFGLFVDNAVVVFDSILRHRERGEDRKTAAVEGAKAVILPVLSSTFTTIIVFFSFAVLFQDRLRVFYLPLAYVIAISLTSSIIVSFVFIPSLSSRLNLKVKQDEGGLFKKGRFFPFILKYPMAVLVPIFLLGIFSYSIFKEEVAFGSFFGFHRDEVVFVGLSYPTGTDLEDVRAGILDFENAALGKPYEKEVNTQLMGRQAWMEVSFPKEVASTGLPLQLKQELVSIATNQAGIAVYVSGFDQEPYRYNPHSGANLPYVIYIRGYNYEKLMDVAGSLKRNLLKHRRIKDVEILTDMKRYGLRDKYYSLKLNREKMRHYNLSPNVLLRFINSCLRESSQKNRIKFNDKELSIEIKAENVDNMELDELLNKHFTVANGSEFRIKDMVTVGLALQRGGISRENQEYVSRVEWDYLGTAKSGTRLHKTVFKNLRVPVGFSKNLEKDRNKMSEEEEHQLNYAILLSAFLIYLILGMLYENFFQPILIMLSIPLALIGVFLAFVIMDFSFDSTAYIGVILLMGIVVNNAILLIDNINQHLARSGLLIESIAIATKERVRPIFMTSLTTVLGMIPLLVFKESGSSGNSDIWSNLALCTVGGLTTSALLILLVLPVFYYLFYQFQKFLLYHKPQEAAVAANGETLALQEVPATQGESPGSGPGPVDGPK
ncbi:MAG: efflux RND transporter permease subunit, partial [bacterium]|nr:efflux RND transporter permease subunit [bacterium]